MMHLDRSKYPTVLLTGFDPFGGETINPSWLAVQALNDKIIEGHRIVAGQLPTQFVASLQRLDELLSEHAPAMVICVGQAPRLAISLERIAINVDDARIPDNAQQSPIDTLIVAGGPAAYFTTLPIKAMLSAVTSEGIAAEVSQTAGTFVCNHVFYGLMHRLATRAALAHLRGGFIHVPALPGQNQSTGAMPGMPLTTLIQGLHTAVSAALAHTNDIALSAGALG